MIMIMIYLMLCHYYCILSMEEKETQEYAAAHPFRVIDTVGLKAKDQEIPIHPNISLYSSVGFALDVSGHPKAVSPEQVC